MNMFIRKQKNNNDDVKKQASKILDNKKDLNSRLKYLKGFIDSNDISDIKAFFELYISQIYYIFYEQFVITETNSKIKFLKQHKEELDSVLFVFHKVLILQPDKIRNRWQARSIGQIMEKLLHIGNTIWVKFFGIRAFLLWYQILGQNKTTIEELMFQKLIQGFEIFHIHNNNTTEIDLLNAEAQKIFNTTNNIDGKIYPIEITPLLPMQTNEHMSNVTAKMFKKMLNYMQDDCLAIEWNDKSQYQKCYEFLFDEFKRYYLTYMFPGAFINNNLSRASFINVFKSSNLLSQTHDIPIFDKSIVNDERKIIQLLCKEEVINWLIDVLLIDSENDGSVNDNSTIKANFDDFHELNFDNNNINNPYSTLWIASPLSPSSSTINIKSMIQKVILSNAENVNLVHEIIRQAFILNFENSSTIKKVLDAYKKWFLKEALLPIFMQEPSQIQFESQSETISDIRVGFTQSLHIFMHYSSFLFMNRFNFQREKIVNVCSHALDIYKLLIENVDMDSNTWTFLITILLRVSDFLFNSEYFLNNRNDASISNLIKSTIENILLAFEKSFLNSKLSNDLWDQLLNLLSAMNSYTEVVDKWIESIDKLIKQLLKTHYQIDINELKSQGYPIDKKRSKLIKMISNANEMKIHQSNNPPSSASVLIVQNAQYDNLDNLSKNEKIQSSNEDYASSQDGDSDRDDRSSTLKARNQSKIEKHDYTESNSLSSKISNTSIGSSSYKKQNNGGSYVENIKIHDNELADYTNVAAETSSIEHEFNKELLASSVTSHTSEYNVETTEQFSFNVNEEELVQVKSQELTESRNYCILIKRLFGCLGNINDIKDPLIHKHVLEFIFNKLELLDKLKDNINVCEIMVFIPPFATIVPRLFQTIYNLPNIYQAGKLVAYKALCLIATTFLELLENVDKVNFTEEFMDLFYITVHKGLRSPEKSVVDCIIQSCSNKFFHCMLPSFTLLFKDFIDACSKSEKQGTRQDAALILSYLCGFSNYFSNIKAFDDPPPGVNSEDGLFVNTFSPEIFKNLLIYSLSDFAINDMYSDINTRCIISSILTCFIYEEILNNNWNKKLLTDAINIIFNELSIKEDSNLTIVKVSCDNLRFLAHLAETIFDSEIQFAIDIISILNNSLIKLTTNQQIYSPDDYSKVLISNMFALLEWYMYSPLTQLKDSDRTSLLNNIFKLLVHVCIKFKNSSINHSENIYLTAKFIIGHLMKHLNHFPLGITGTSKIISSVNEINDFYLDTTEDLSNNIFDKPNIQFFTLNNQYLISFIELPSKNYIQNFGINDRLDINNTVCRFIIRDYSGKYCWDSCMLRNLNDNRPRYDYLDFYNSSMDVVQDKDNTKLVNENRTIDKTTFLSSYSDNNTDILQNVLYYVQTSSPECVLKKDSSNGEISNCLTFLKIEETREKLKSQRSKEAEHMTLKKESSILEHRATANNLERGHPESKLNQQMQSYFSLCKSFVHQLGLLSWEKRQSFNLLKKSPQLLRELKSLDDQTCRETHKIAIIYIGPGQNDKQSILSNEIGSLDYESFVNSLGWNIDLENHEGFMGGLQRNYRLKTTSYFSNSTTELLFHVSTRMNNHHDENKISKWRHLGNDNVQIIWSDNKKDYNRNILATEFADVIICIYPIKKYLYRIQIDKKPSVGIFGPLFNGAIVNQHTLPALVRATAINASRLLLSKTNGFKDFYIHRAHAINNIIRTQTEHETFEEFITDLYSPSSNQLVKKDSETNTNLS